MTFFTGAGENFRLPVYSVFSTHILFDALLVFSRGTSRRHGNPRKGVKEK